MEEITFNRDGEAVPPDRVGEAAIVDGVHEGLIHMSTVSSRSMSDCQHSEGRARLLHRAWLAAATIDCSEMKSLQGVEQAADTVDCPVSNETSYPLSRIDADARRRSRPRAKTWSWSIA